MDPRHRPPMRPVDAAALVGGDLSSRLERWAADARVEAAAQRRSRERWLRQQAEEAATLSAVLVDLAEAETPVVVETAAGRRHQGVVSGVGADFVALSGPGPAVIVAVAALVAVRTAPGTTQALGLRPSTRGTRLVDVLAGMAADRERVAVVTLPGGNAVAGILHSVGRDVVVVRSQGERTTPTYVPLGAVGEVLLDG